MTTTSDPFNSLGGFSVGVQPTILIVNSQGNVYANSLATDCLTYSNGQHYAFATAVAGTNTQVQFNDEGGFGASSAFTYDKVTSTLAVATITATSYGNAVAANYLIGDGTYISNIAVSSGTYLLNGTSNVVVYPSANVAVSVSGVSNVVVVTTAGANVTGVLAVTAAVTAPTVIATTLIGDLTGTASTANAVAGANVTGEVAFAATANAMAGANVVGQVANAVYSDQSLFADTANAVAGANVTGAVATATFATTAATADSVAGANVTGEVAFAATANAVAGANVVGQVANAVYADLSAYATTANAVAGANVVGQVASALTADTVTTAAQPNITSTGTLTTLTVSGTTTTTDLFITGNVLTDLLPSANVTYDLGSATQRWKDLYLSNNTIFLGDATLSANATSIMLSPANSSNVLIVTDVGITVAGNLATTGAFMCDTIVAQTITGNIINSGGGIDGNVTQANQPFITSLGTLTELTVAGNTQTENLHANTTQMGIGAHLFTTNSVHVATTSSTAAGQVLWSVPCASVSAVDFTIVSTDVTGNTRQTSKISSVVLGNEVAFNETSGLQINGGVGVFTVECNDVGPVYSLELRIKPDSSATTTYKMLITAYEP